MNCSVSDKNGKTHSRELNVLTVLISLLISVDGVRLTHEEAACALLHLLDYCERR